VQRLPVIGVIFKDPFSSRLSCCELGANSHYPWYRHRSHYSADHDSRCPDMFSEFGVHNTALGTQNTVKNILTCAKLVSRRRKSELRQIILKNELHSNREML
jgi:hypothetical protein